jgi:predicted phosphoribosyltransferase
MGRKRYADRDEAGEVLADQLNGYAGRDDVVVLGLPRGGVPVAARVAAVLQVPLDVLVVRKLGLPGQPELAMGAVAGVGPDVEVVRNAPVLAATEVSADAFDDVYRREVAELHQRESAYRTRRSRAPLQGRAVIVVDDGLATGSTMRAAVAAVRRQRPARLVAAVPVGAHQACTVLREGVDELVCPWTPEPFIAVGQAYRDFSQTSDEQVRTALAAGIEEPHGRLKTGER